MALRTSSDPLGYAHTEHRYDHDFNRLSDDEDGPFATPTYDVDADSVPATQFEKIFRLLCNVPHQGLLLYHQAIQGTIILIITVFRILINTIR